MKKIFIINGGQAFAHSGGKFNQLIVAWDRSFFEGNSDFDVRITDIKDPYTPGKEVQNFVWADTILYHTPVWWFGLPHPLKQYIDVVFTAGHRKGMYYSDGRKQEDPTVNYGTGGSLHGRNYLLTTTWNAPDTAFTLPNEFFHQRSVDDGVMFGFHRMNAFTGMAQLPGFHFHDLEKNGTPERIEAYRRQYLAHLAHVFHVQTPVAAERAEHHALCA